MIYAYKQALLCLGYHADIWYEAALYMQEAEVRLVVYGLVIRWIWVYQFPLR